MSGTSKPRRFVANQRIPRTASMIKEAEEKLSRRQPYFYEVDPRYRQEYQPVERTQEQIQAHEEAQEIYRSALGLSNDRVDWKPRPVIKVSWFEDARLIEKLAIVYRHLKYENVFISKERYQNLLRLQVKTDSLKCTLIPTERNQILEEITSILLKSEENIGSVLSETEELRSNEIAIRFGSVDLNVADIESCISGGTLKVPYSFPAVMEKVRDKSVYPKLVHSIIQEQNHVKVSGTNNYYYQLVIIFLYYLERIRLTFQRGKDNVFEIGNRNIVNRQCEPGIVKDPEKRWFVNPSCVPRTEFSVF